MIETPYARRALTENEAAVLRASAAGLARDAVATRLGITTREVEVGLRGRRRSSVPARGSGPSWPPSGWPPSGSA
jgi:FixJ family two-component response regulator